MNIASSIDFVHGRKYSEALIVTDERLAVYL